MEIIIIHQNTKQILYRGELIIIPGIGTKVHINKKPFEKLIEEEIKKLEKQGGIKIKNYDDHGRLPDTGYRTITDYDSLREYAINDVGIDPDNFTTVLNLEHCPITGDTKVFVGKRPKQNSFKHTESKIINRNISSNSRRKEEDDFLDGFLLTGLVVSALD